MLSLNAVQQQLASLQTNGVNCQLNELVRYRALARKLNLHPTGNIRNSMAGSLTSRFKGRGMEFDEARHYQPGDDIRSIDWRVTARTGKTHTKLYREERERPVLIFVDLNDSMHFGTCLLYKSIQAMHMTALISFSALARGDKIGAMVTSENSSFEVKPKSTAKHALGMLNQLVTFQNQSVANVKSSLNTNKRLAKNDKLNRRQQAIDYLNRLAMLAKPGSLVYIISDFALYNEHAIGVLGKISRHCEVRPVQVYDPIEQSLPSVHSIHDVLVSNGEQEQQLLLGDKQTQQAYANTRSAWFDYLKSQMEQTGLHLRRVSASSPIEKQLIAGKSGLVLGELA